MFISDYKDGFNPLYTFNVSANSSTGIVTVPGHEYSVETTYIKGSKNGYVTSLDESEYPDNDGQGNYYYIKR